MEFVRRHRICLLLALAAVPVYCLYIYDITGNPPGFFVDEAVASFNAYKIHLSGQGEFGNSWPLYFPVMQVPGTSDFYGYLDPVQVYLLAALFTLFAPSVLLPRLLSATAMFVASILLGVLGKRISGRIDVGIITTVTALVTPWLFEMSRMAFGASLYPLAIVLLLLFLHIASKKDRWPWWNIFVVAVGLALTTYTYSVGRLLGPILAIGLILFATNRERFTNVLKTWAIYALTLLPMLVFHLRNPTALMGRFDKTVGIVAPNLSFLKIVSIFVSNYLENINPQRLLLTGDTNLRHHITDTGPMLALTLLLAFGGTVLIIVKFRKDAWWRYILFGTLVSIIPASLTKEQFHMLRLGALPVFLLVLIIPTLTWLLGTRKVDNGLDTETESQHWKAVYLTRRGLAVAALVALTFAQAVYFQSAYRTIGTTRGTLFDAGYRPVFNAALATRSRPIYLVDGYWGEDYVLAYWYATIDGVDLSNFVHLTTKGQRPPVGAIVISSDDRCDSCEPIFQDGQFVLYRQIDTNKTSTTPQ